MRREAEAQVRELEQQQRAVIDNMVGGLVTFDENLLVTRINPAALRLLRAAPSCVGRPLAQGAARAPSPRTSPAAFRGGEPTVNRREIRVAFADGRELVLGYVLSRIPPSEGRGAQGIVLFRDLTDERRLAAEQQRLNRLTTLGEFSAQVAHELRNPLTAMSSTVQYLAAASEGARPGAAADHHREHRAHGGDHQAHAAALARDAAGAHQRRPRRPARAPAARSSRPRCGSRGSRALFRPPAAPVLVTGDPAQLHQALLNLLMNAHAGHAAGGAPAGAAGARAAARRRGAAPGA